MSYRPFAQKTERQMFAEWFAGLSDKDKAFARAADIDKPMSSHGRNDAQAGPDLDFCDPAEIHEASISMHPVDFIEPAETSVEVEQLTRDEVRIASDTFESCLRWAINGAGLVEMGKRSIVIIAAMRRDLAKGLAVDSRLTRAFIRNFSDSGEIGLNLQSTGVIYSRFLEWMRRAATLSALGERLQLVAYELRPDLIDAGTLQALGELTNKTRQAKDKSVNCLRDTFSGLKAITMRADITRLRCQKSQLQK